MTLPNKLSLSRILVIPLFLFCVLVWGPDSENPLVTGWFRLAALLIVIAASITDYYDGKIARETGEVSNLGKLLDPLADKLLVTAAFVAFVDLQLFPSWLIVIILCREFLVTGLRSLAASQGVVIAADRWGKHKTGWQLGSIITTLVFVTAREFLRAAGLWRDPLVSEYSAQAIFDGVLYGVLFVAVVLTVVSGGLYLVRNWALIRDAD
jgi:CDP-diacylglycerol--glycerol-3-phosphate 3-phosphatidyltransferase